MAHLSRFHLEVIVGHDSVQSTRVRDLKRDCVSMRLCPIDSCQEASCLGELRCATSTRTFKAIQQ